MKNHPAFFQQLHNLVDSPALLAFNSIINPFQPFRYKWLEYGQEAVVPFYVLHQPVIVVIAFYVVQWQAGVSVKMFAVVLASFAVTVGIYELLIRRMAPLRALFGMKARPRPPALQPQEATPASGAGPQPSA